MGTAYSVLYVYNTITGTVENKEVTKEIYNAYRRLGYNEGYRNRKARKHETVFSGLDGNFENYHGFRQGDADPPHILSKIEAAEELNGALGKLTSDEIKLLMVFSEIGLSGKKCAAGLGIPYTTFRYRKDRVLKKLRNILLEGPQTK